MIESRKQDDVAEFDVTEGEFDAMMAESDQVEVTGPPTVARHVQFELINGTLRTPYAASPPARLARRWQSQRT